MKQKNITRSIFNLEKQLKKALGAYLIRKKTRKHYDLIEDQVQERMLRKDFTVGNR